MKTTFFKSILLLLFITIASFSVCYSQQPAQKPAQNTEVLGENERIPFMQTENPVAINETSSVGLIVKTLGAMILIISLIFFGAWGLKKFGFGNANSNLDEDIPDLAILSTVSLGSGRTISTVRFGERILLVGSTPQSFTLLGDEAEKRALNHVSASENRISVAEMLAAEDTEEFKEHKNSFAETFIQAEKNLDSWKTQGEKI